jgi:RimJ/RimL family protein N-acetyltransferase
MATLIFGHSEVLADWAARRIPHVGATGFGPCQAIGVASGDGPEARLYAVCVYHDWQPGYQTLQLSMAAASPRWATPGTIRALLHYAFMQCGARKVWTATPHKNARAIKFNKGIGFRQDGVLREHFGPHQHAVIYSMLKAEWERSGWFVLPERLAA